MNLFRSLLPVKLRDKNCSCAYVVSDVVKNATKVESHKSHLTLSITSHLTVVLNLTKWTKKKNLVFRKPFTFFSKKNLHRGTILELTSEHSMFKCLKASHAKQNLYISSLYVHPLLLYKRPFHFVYIVLLSLLLCICLKRLVCLLKLSAQSLSYFCLFCDFLTSLPFTRKYLLFVRYFMFFMFSRPTRTCAVWHLFHWFSSLRVFLPLDILYFHLLILNSLRFGIRWLYQLY